MSATAARDFARLRAEVRAILFTEGVAIASGTQTPERVDTVIAELVQRQRPALERETDALAERASDRDFQIEISDHANDIGIAYGDAGYFVGLAMGLEVAALTLATPSGRMPKKGGRR